jgi:hypothetical protein
LKTAADQESLISRIRQQKRVENGRNGSTHDVDEDGNEDGGSYSSSVFGVINAPDELLVAVLVDKTENR